MRIAADEHSKLLKLLADMSEAIEELLLTGLTTASAATRQALEVAFREASRMRLLRLGSTLRVANEELGRFTGNNPEFSRTRFFFFLSRAWLLSRGLANALAKKDEATIDRLLWTATSEPIDRRQVVTVGVRKKVSSSFIAFDFRLRAVNDSGKIKAGDRLG